MKRILTLAVILILLLTLVGCSDDVGGSYQLEYITSDGVRMSPSTFGMNIYFELSEDGIGTATYGGTTVDITWIDEDNEVVITSQHETLRFTRDGSNLVLHSDGTLLFFVREEEEEDDD